MSIVPNHNAIEPLWSDRLPRPHFRYSPLVRAGAFYKTAGLIALLPETGTLEPGGPGAQTARILANLTAALPDFGLTLGDLMSVTLYTTRFDAFGEINAAWNAVFTADRPAPARTSVGVAALPLAASVEMEFWFYRRSSTTS